MLPTQKPDSCALHVDSAHWPSRFSPNINSSVCFFFCVFPPLFKKISIGTETSKIAGKILHTNRTVSPSAFAQLFHIDVVFVLVFEDDGDYVKYFNFPFAWTVSFFFLNFFFSLFSLFELLWCKIHVGKLKLQNFENFRAAFISDINIYIYIFYIKKKKKPLLF